MKEDRVAKYREETETDQRGQRKREDRDRKRREWTERREH